jgi:hypothetical protein
LCFYVFLYIYVSKGGIKLSVDFILKLTVLLLKTHLNKPMPSGAAYKLIICYVTVNGAPPYSEDNGMATLIDK